MSLRAFAFGVGRISRRTFWLWHTLLLAAGLILSFVITLVFGLGQAVLPRLLLLLIWIVLAWLWTAQAVRRLHDFGRHGYWAAPALLLWVGLIGAGIFLPMMAIAALSWAPYGLMASAAMTSLGLAALIWLGLKSGDHAANAFGPPTWISHPDPPAGSLPGAGSLPKDEAATK
jgi:uncharacterized membrane protein YhaH (DUF805 family)